MALCGGWAELYPDLLDQVAKHIPLYDDYIRLRAACKSWNTALPKIPRYIRGPGLVLPFDDETFQIEKKEAYHLRLPELKNTRLRGSCFGWLISVGIDGELRVLNPFTGSSFHLPPISTFPSVVSYQPDKHGQEYAVRDVAEDEDGSVYTDDSKRMRNAYIEKIILSSSPEEEEDFMAVAIYGDYPGLAFYRSGDDKWTDITWRDGFQDVIFGEGKIYAIDWRAHLYKFDMKTLSGGISAVPPPPNIYSKDKYLVRNPDGHLLMAVRHVDRRKAERYSYKTTGFDIFKLDESTKRWCREFSLGNYVLIVGYNSSIWKPPFADEEGNCARNCIYYTDNNVREQYDEVNGGLDIGVFNLEDGSIKQLFPDSGFFCPPPVWI